MALVARQTLSGGGGATHFRLASAAEFDGWVYTACRVSEHHPWKYWKSSC